MLKTERRISKETIRTKIPKRVQEIIPIDKIYDDGIFLSDKKYTKTFIFTDVNYCVTSKENRENLFRKYSEMLNTFDPFIEYQFSIYNRKIDKDEFENNVLLKLMGDELDEYRIVQNDMLRQKAKLGNNIIQEKYITISVIKKDIEEARLVFSRIYTEIGVHMKALGSFLTELTTNARMKILHDFYRQGEEDYFSFDLQMLMQKRQNFKDYICPDSAEFKKDYFIAGKKFGRVLFVKDYLSWATDTMINDVITSVVKSMILTVNVNPVPLGESVKEAENILLGVEKNINDWQQRQNQNDNYTANIPYSYNQEREVIKKFLDDLTVRDQKCFLTTTTIVHLADSLKELDNDTDIIVSMGRKDAQIAVLNFQQLDGLNTTLPIGTRCIVALRSLITESLSTVCMPFSAQEISHKNGQYVGVNAISKNMILVNRKSLLNGNAFIFGVSGGGKSFSAKKEISNIALSSNDDIIIIDPENEYSSICREFGGEVIEISATSDIHINAMDITKEYGEGNMPIKLKSEFIMSLCEQLMTGTTLHPQQKSLVDRALHKVYKEYIKNNYTGEVPTLVDLYNELLSQKVDESRDLALAMELFVHGSLNTFAKPTNVDTDNRIISYNTVGLGSQLQPIGMLVILDSILNRITSNRVKGKNTFIFIDEIYLLFRHEFTANFLSVLWKRVRKYGGFATGITQNIDDMLQSHTARTMVANSEYIVMLNQSGNDRMLLGKLLNISEEQLSYIENAPVGSGLLKVGSSLVPFIDDYPKNKLYELMTTKPNENNE